MAFARPEHNAFLNRSVRTTSELVTEFQRDSKVRKRYKLKFRASDSVIVGFFRGLHVEPLRKTRRYLVFNVDGRFVIRSRHLLLKKGVLVFADASHVPVLKTSCGNPLLASLPQRGEPDSQLHSAPGDSQSLLSRSGPDASGLEDTPPDALTGVEPFVVPSPIADIGTLDVADVDSPAAPMTSDEPTAGPGPGSAVGETPGGVVSFIPLFGLLGMTSLDHGHSVVPAAPTPEPATVLPIGLGVVWLGFRRRSRM